MIIRLLISDIFTFVVGEDKVEFRVHSDVIARLSSTCHALVNTMSAGQSRSEHLPDVDPVTFTRVCEFAYTNDYTPVAFEGSDLQEDSLSESSWSPPDDESTIASSEELTDDTVAVAQEDLKPTPPRTKPTSAKDGKEEIEVLDLLDVDDYDAPDGCGSRINYNPSYNYESSHDVTPTLLCHAKLYVFAEKYDISDLSQLALHKLNRNLLLFTIFTSRVNDILTLVRFTYSNDSTPTYEHKVDRLRRLVVWYVAENRDQIADRKEFLELMSEGGEFVTDLWKVMRQGLGKY